MWLHLKIWHKSVLLQMKISNHPSFNINKAKKKNLRIIFYLAFQLANIYIVLMSASERHLKLCWVIGKGHKQLEWELIVFEMCEPPQRGNTWATGLDFEQHQVEVRNSSESKRPTDIQVTDIILRQKGNFTHFYTTASSKVSLLFTIVTEYHFCELQGIFP